jgi:hypothetical protein
MTFLLSLHKISLSETSQKKVIAKFQDDSFKTEFQDESKTLYSIGYISKIIRNQNLKFLPPVP